MAGDDEQVAGAGGCYVEPRSKAGHALATIGKHIAPLLTATLGPQAASPFGSAAQLRGR